MANRFVDYYQVLGVTKDSSDKEIKQAFRRLANDLHPDKNREASADLRAQKEEKFKAVGEAYAILSDSEERQKYNAIWSSKQKEQREGADVSENAAGHARNTANEAFNGFRAANAERARHFTNRPFEEILAEVDRTMSESVRFADDAMRRSIEWVDKVFQGSGLTPLGESPFFATGAGNYDQKKWEAEQRATAQRNREEREQRQAREKEEVARLKEAGRNQALNMEIKIPENDRYLVLAMMKLVKNKELDKIDVKDENGILLWRVEGVDRRALPPFFEVSRSLADIVDPERNISIKTKEGGKMFPVEVEREIIPGRVFNVRDIEETSKWRGREGLPIGLPEYVRTLGNAAFSLTVMEKGGGKGWISEGTKQSVETYLSVNRELNLGEVKEVKIGELTKGLDEGRLTETSKMDEGKFNDK